MLGLLLMDYQLLVVRGRSAANALKLVDGVTTVGRHDDCQIRIKSSQVSRRHCEFFEKKGLLLVKDLGSANGTLVNGKKVQGQQVLEPGDELTIGGITLRVAKVGETPPATPTAAPSSKSPSDTAVVAAQLKPAAVASASEDDDFEIDFDDDPSIEPEPVELDSVAADIFAETKTASPASPVKPSAPTPSAAPPAKAAEPAAAPPEPAPADEAIADFLLGIKLDEDD